MSGSEEKKSLFTTSYQNYTIYFFRKELNVRSKCQRTYFIYKLCMFWRYFSKSPVSPNVLPICSYKLKCLRIVLWKISKPENLKLYINIHVTHVKKQISVCTLPPYLYKLKVLVSTPNAILNATTLKDTLETTSKNIITLYIWILISSDSDTIWF